MLFMRIADVHHFLGYDYLTGQHLGSRPLTMVSAFSHQQMCALLLASRKAKELVKSLDQGTMGTASWERVTGNHGESQMRVSFSSGPISDHDEEERKTPHTTVGEHGKELVIEIL
jgi:hypothetical protein